MLSMTEQAQPGASLYLICAVFCVFANWMGNQPLNKRINVEFSRRKKENKLQRSQPSCAALA